MTMPTKPSDIQDFRPRGWDVGGKSNHTQACLDDSSGCCSCMPDGCAPGCEHDPDGYAARIDADLQLEGYLDD